VVTWYSKGKVKVLSRGLTTNSLENNLRKESKTNLGIVGLVDSTPSISVEVVA
jgi:hypothetical protein